MPMNARRPLLAASALAASLGLAASASAVTIDFNSDGAFANNFHAYPVFNGVYAQSSATGNLTWTTAGGQTGAFVYDTNGSAAGGVTNFIPGVGNSVSVAFDFSTSVNNSSVGVYFGGARNAEKFALFNINNTSATNDQLRIFSVSDWNTSTPATNGTTANPSANQSLSTGGWTTNTTYRALFTMTYTSATTADVVFTISGTSISPFSVSASGVSVSSTLNEIGFRTGMGNAGGVITLDNISITTSAVPEPSAAAALGGLAALGFAALRRRARR